MNNSKYDNAGLEKLAHFYLNEEQVSRLLYHLPEEEIDLICIIKQAGINIFKDWK